jgi:hypothetical protein
MALANAFFCFAASRSRAEAISDFEIGIYERRRPLSAKSEIRNPTSEINVA